MKDENEFTQAGFDAISNTLHSLYPNQEGVYYGTVIPYFLGGNDPLDGVEIWECDKCVPHWHYVTYGFTELYEKESDNADESGYGFELTFRLKKENEEQPPVWPVNLLQNLARYVFSSGNVFGEGHHMNANGPIALETDTKLTALGFWKDPILKEMDTPNGHMTFLQVVGLTEDEMDAMMCWNGRKFLSALERIYPMCITDLSRNSALENQDLVKQWREGMEKDGSSTAFLYMDELGAKIENDRLTLRLGAGHNHTLVNMLKARVGKGRDLFIQSENTSVLFCAGDMSAFEEKDNTIVITLSADILEDVCGILKSHSGVYSLNTFPLTAEVVPTKITDANGNVTKVIE